MTNAILVLNAGSSSLKFSVFASDASLSLLLRGQIASLGSGPRFSVRDNSGTLVAEHEWPAGARLAHSEAVKFLLDHGDTRGLFADRRVVAAGHRVVHGGTRFAEPVLMDAEKLNALRSLISLAPLHQPHNLAAIDAVAEHMPGLPQVACFDTAFHRTQPEFAQRFALPRRFADEGVLRYGFHGLSYAYIAAALASQDWAATGLPAELQGCRTTRTIVAHLGNGASLCAMRDGRSIATTMGFTPLDGLPMSTRCGALDPGVLLYLMDQHHLDARGLERLLYHESGLLGVSGVSSDMRTLLTSDNPRAAEAVDLFVYRIGRELGSLAAALGGLDALVFTGGIGENAATIRARVCRDAEWLGLEFDPATNERGGPRISTPDSHVCAWVIPTNEELTIAWHTKNQLSSKPLPLPR